MEMPNGALTVLTVLILSDFSGSKTFFVIFKCLKYPTIFRVNTGIKSNNFYFK